MFITYKFHIVNSRWVFAKLFSFFVAQSLYKTQFLFLVCNLGEYLDLLAYVKSLSGSNKCRYIVGEFIFFYIHSIFYLFSQKKKNSYHSLFYCRNAEQKCSLHICCCSYHIRAIVTQNVLP